MLGLVGCGDTSPSYISDEELEISVLAGRNAKAQRTLYFQSVDSNGVPYVEAPLLVPAVAEKPKEIEEPKVYEKPKIQFKKHSIDQYPLNGGGNETLMVAEDFNNDGLKDIAISVRFGNSRYVTIYENITGTNNPAVSEK